MGMKFGTEEWCKDKVRVQGPKILPHFKILTPCRAYHLHNFHEICSVSSVFRDALAVNIGMDLLKELRSYVGFKLRGSGSPKFSAPPSRETMHRTPKSF